MDNFNQSYFHSFFNRFLNSNYNNYKNENNFAYHSIFSDNNSIVKSKLFNIYEDNVDDKDHDEFIDDFQKIDIESSILDEISDIPLSIHEFIGTKEETLSINDFSLTQNLKLADDLYLATSNALKFAAAQNSNRLPPPIQQTKDNITESSSSSKFILPQKNLSTPNEEDPSTKKSKFSSATSKFKQDGGKFENYNNKETNNNNSNSTSTISNSVLKKSSSSKDEDELPPELAHFDKNLIEKIESEIIHHGQPVSFDDIAGLNFAKECVNELICWPMTQPELFQGLRSLPRGVLLFGPPGTGKTLIGKAIANESGATFFSISASSLMSKWIGEGEKTVRILFALAVLKQPSVVFLDEVDSLLSQRSSDENEASRRIKTEFMIQLDGATTNSNARVIIIGATNRPEELDEAIRRRFVKRIYIPLPDELSRRALINNLLKSTPHNLSNEEMDELIQKTDGFSGADLKALCTDAAMGPVRELVSKNRGNLRNIRKEEISQINYSHFLLALETVSPSVSQKDLQKYYDWNNIYGSYKRIG